MKAANDNPSPAMQAGLDAVRNMDQTAPGIEQGKPRRKGSHHPTRKHWKRPNGRPRAF